VVTLRVSLPTLSLVVLRSAAAFCLPFEGSAAFTGSAGFAEEGLASGFSAAVSFAGAASLPEREEVCAEGLSLLGLAALAADPSVFRGGGGRDPLLPEEVPLLEVVLPDPLLLLLPLLLPLPLLLLLGAAFFLAGAFTTGSFAMGSAVRNTAAAAASRDLRVDQPAIRLGSPNRPSVVWY